MKNTAMSIKSARGFTLVELAIVLVVIGMLLGMAVKGGSLIEAARTKATMNTVSKISTAISAYYSKYGTLPGKDTNNIMNVSQIYNDLVNTGMLAKKDFDSGIRWVFAGCKEWSGDAVVQWTSVDLSARFPICITANSKPIWDESATNVNPKNLTIDAYTICQLETTLDDSNLQGGEGRLIRGGTGTAALPDDLSGVDCADYTNSKNDTSKANGKSYMFRVY